MWAALQVAYPSCVTNVCDQHNIKGGEAYLPPYTPLPTNTKNTLLNTYITRILTK